MHSIEVDFEVLKALMAKRPTESVTNNDVIRDLLRLPKATRGSTSEPSSAVGASGDWVVKGVRFPAGMEFRAHHAGQFHSARVEAGRLVLNDKGYDSPSAAGVALTGYAVNGWTFWECRAPGGEWRTMSTFRKR